MRDALAVKSKLATITTALTAMECVLMWLGAGLGRLTR